MKTLGRTLATAELLLIFPAVLFLCAVFLSSIQPAQLEPAHTSRQIVSWYSARPHVGLWLLLVTLPLTVLVTGSVTLLRAWKRDARFQQAALRVFTAMRAHLAACLVAVATVAAAGILAVVAFHMLTN